VLDGSVDSTFCLQDRADPENPGEGLLFPQPINAATLTVSRSTQDLRFCLAWGVHDMALLIRPCLQDRADPEKPGEGLLFPQPINASKLAVSRSTQDLRFCLAWGVHGTFVQYLLVQS
jgi:hypothetical protein